MRNVIDLSSLKPEDLTLKFGEDDSFDIPLEQNAGFIRSLLDLEEKAKKAKTSKAEFDLFIEMTTMILNQDKNRDIDNNWVEEHLSVNQMQAIVQAYRDKIIENFQD